MLVSAIERLENKLTSFHEPPRQQSYATVASTEPHPQSSPLLSTSHSQKSLIMPAAQKGTFRPSAQDGRESNVILFGLAETQSLVEVKSTVDELLEFLSGKQVEIKDMFRLGRYKQSATRPRPLLIKLSTGWDRKLILLRKRDLRNFRIKRLFLCEDVAPGHKLRQRQSAPPPQDNTTALSSTVPLTAIDQSSTTNVNKQAMISSVMKTTEQQAPASAKDIPSQPCLDSTVIPHQYHSTSPLPQSHSTHSSSLSPASTASSSTIVTGNEITINDGST